MDRYIFILSILKNYIYEIKTVRFLLSPILILAFLSRILEVRIASLLEDLSKNFGGNGKLLAVYLVTGLLASLFIELQGFIFTTPLQIIYKRATEDLFSYFLSLPNSEFKKYSVGEIDRIISRRSYSITEMIDVSVLNLLPTIVVILLCLFRIYININMTSCLIITISLLTYIYITIRMAIYRNLIRNKLNLQNNKIGSFLYDRLSKYNIITGFNNEETELFKFKNILLNRKKINEHLWRTFYLLNFLQRIVFIFQTFFIIYFNSTEKFVFYLTIARILAQNLDKLGYMYSRFTSALINLQTDNLPLIEKKYKQPISKIELIEAKNLSIAYDGYKIIENMNFTIREKEKVAIFGKNGKGKSSLINLLMGFSTEYSGSLKINNIELRNISLRSLRNHLSIAPQNYQLLNMDIYENIQYGGLICKNKIEALLNYYKIKNKPVDQLSGGQKQTISLLRSIVRRADLYLFDEPTANLDSEKEKQAIKQIISVNGAVLAVIHNEKLLEQFDRVIQI